MSMSLNSDMTPSLRRLTSRLGCEKFSLRNGWTSHCIPHAQRSTPRIQLGYAEYRLHARSYGLYVIVRAGLDSSHGVADLRAESIGLSILLRNESDSLE
jgi:hypothetical protein